MVVLAKPYVVLPLPPNPATLTLKLEGKDRAVFLEGDVLTLLHRRKGGYVGVTGGVQESMTPVPGTDLWVLRVKMKGWDRAVIQYAFFTPDHPTPSFEEYGVWRGPAAPTVELARPLKGQFQQFDFASKELGAKRRIAIYFPPNPTPDLPAIYMADGEGTEGLAQVLEPLILTGRMAPCALIGAFSGDWGGHGRRSQEYGEGEAKHRRFFSLELPAWATAKYRLSGKRENRAVMGFSAGASFAARVARSNFGVAICLAGGRAATPSAGLRWFFGVGSLDPARDATASAARRLKSPLAEFTGGHDFEIWRLCFADLIPRAFPAKKL